jgi:DNA-binding NtrC family response regulator
MKEVRADTGSFRGGPSLSELREKNERELILAALAAHGNCRRLAALSLGISLRTLHNKLNQLGLRPLVATYRRPRRGHAARAFLLSCMAS